MCDNDAMGTAEWTPCMKFEGLASGRSARSWARPGELSSYGFMVPFVIGMVVFGMSGPGGQPIDNAVMAMWAIYLLLPAAIVALYYKDRRRERKRGYTTVFNRFQYLPQVDDRSGRVIRLPGEDYLTPEEWDRRMALIRQAIEADERAVSGGDDPV